MNTEIKSKVCTKCKEEKALEEFSKDKKGKYRRKSQCKACISSAMKAYQQTNFEKISIKMKKYYQANREKIAVQQKTYYEANREKKLAKQKAYYEANREEIIAQKNIYLKKRYAEDPVYKTKCLLRAQTSRLGDYKSKSTIEIVGCSPQEFWKRNGSPSAEELKDFHIDHIVPLSWFDLSNEDHVAVSSHHSNLQYLSDEDNRAKSNSYAGRPDNIIAYKDNFDIEAYVTDMLPLINIL